MYTSLYKRLTKSQKNDIITYVVSSFNNYTHCVLLSTPMTLKLYVRKRANNCSLHKHNAERQWHAQLLPGRPYLASNAFTASLALGQRPQAVEVNYTTLVRSTSFPLGEMSHLRSIATKAIRL